MDALHQIERSAEDGGVVARQDRPRDAHRGLAESVEHPVLAQHVVSRREERSARRPPEHPFLAAATNEEGLVGMAGLVALDGELPRTGKVLLEVGRERDLVYEGRKCLGHRTKATAELFSRTPIPQLGFEKSCGAAPDYAAGTMRLWFALPCLLVAGTACVGEPVTAGGRASAGLYDVFMAIAAVVFVVVASLIGWSIVAYRRKDGDEALPRQFRDNVKLEILWFAIPQLIVIGLFAGSVLALNDVDEESRDPALTIGVDAFQWGWRFTYETTDVVVDSLPDDPAEIVIPVGETITFSLTSSDVVHSFYVPAFFQKRDVVPGLTNRMDVVVEEPGIYDAKCAEFCGLLHDRMDFTIRAAPRAEYEAWLTRSEPVDE